MLVSGRGILSESSEREYIHMLSLIEMKSNGYWGFKENQGTMRQMDLCGHNLINESYGRR